MSATWKRRLYRDGRPRGPMRALNRLDALLYRVLPIRLTRGTVLCVRGRHSGRVRRIPLALLRYRGERYLVPMLGEGAGWVRDVRAAGGYARLCGRHSAPVRLLEVPVGERPQLLRAYLRMAPGARAHMPVDHRAPLEDVTAIAPRYPVFRLALP